MIRPLGRDLSTGVPIWYPRRTDVYGYCCSLAYVWRKENLDHTAKASAKTRSKPENLIADKRLLGGTRSPREEISEPLEPNLLNMIVPQARAVSA
jgi:hypothetical protein